MNSSQKSLSDISSKLSSAVGDGIVSISDSLDTLAGAVAGGIVSVEDATANVHASKIAGAVNADDTINVLGLTATCDLPLLGEVIPSASRSADYAGVVIDLRDLYHKIGADLMQLIFAVTTIGAGNTLSLQLDWYDCDITGNLSTTTAAKTVTAQAEATANGVTTYAIPVADQFWPGLRVTITRTAGSASYTGSVKLGYVTSRAVRQ